MDRLLHTKEWMRYCTDAAVLKHWDERARAYLRERADLTGEEEQETIAVALNIRAGDSESMKKMYFRYFAYTHPKRQF